MTASNEELHAKLKDFLDEKGQSLEPLQPDIGVKRFLRSVKPEVAESTLQHYRGKLQFFLEYCDLHEIENLNDLDGRVVDAYRTWRREESSARVEQLSRKTMRDDMLVLRKFLRYLVSIEAVSAGLPDKVPVPTIPHEEASRDIELTPKRVQKILDHLEKYEYATTEHVVWLLHCRTGRRPGGLYSLDCEDVDVATDEPYIAFQHRDSETRLKNGSKSEAKVTIKQDVAEVIRDYLRDRRIETVDEHGRRPLFTSKKGRLAKSSMRRYFYKWTRPCQISSECPHNRSVEECEAVDSLNDASKCPSSRPPYSTRHGYFTEMRRKGVPIAVLSERCDVSEEILKKHYDERSEKEKSELRRKLLDEVESQGGGYL